MRLRSAFSIGGLLIAGVVIAAQSPHAGSALHFDAASIKENKSGFPGYTTNDGADGRYVAVNTSVRTLLRFAFSGVATELVGVPPWAGKLSFDVNATTGTRADVSQVREMVRSLLVDRFNLLFHVESRDYPAYALTPAKENGLLGPNIRRTAANCAEMAAAVNRGEQIPAVSNGAPTCGFRQSGGVMHSGGITMPVFAQFLRSAAGRLVVDRTNLPGDYEFTLAYSIDLSKATEVPSIFSALEEQLGLKLRPVIAPMPTLVVERLDPPAAD